jgi:biotin transporter BioY
MPIDKLPRVIAMVAGIAVDDSCGVFVLAIRFDIREHPNFIVITVIVIPYTMDLWPCHVVGEIEIGHLLGAF